ncbi:TAL effector repeat-containing protein [Mycetohabitans sp. B6]|nr:TAL effector repeat-containing protein [Mycetohabitans sp. B6]
MKTVLEHGPTLRQRDLSLIDIVEIASNGGAQALKAVLKYGPVLMQAGRSNEEIVHVAARRGGAGRIRKMVALLLERQ